MSKLSGAETKQPFIAGAELSRASRAHTVRALAGLAAAMGVGRFVYTPILPLMQHGTGVSHSETAIVATMNYLGYFVGAVVMGTRPAWARSRALYQWSMGALIASELAMILAANVELWSAARLIAGAASAVVFIYCTTAIVGTSSAGPAYAGVGVGVAVSGLVVVVLEDRVAWAPMWIIAAVLTAVFAAVAWPLAPGSVPVATRTAGPRSAVRGRRMGWWLLGGSYFLEGVGYIILGTFLVAAVSAGGPQWTGPASWVLVGCAAAVSPGLWAAARRRYSPELLLTTALLLQAISAGLPALVGGTAAAAIAAVLFGGTFMGITMLAMVSGADLDVPRSAAVLTAAYGLGQIIGPVAVSPMLGAGYRTAFLCAAGILAAAAALADLTRRYRRRTRI